MAMLQRFRRAVPAIFSALSTASYATHRIEAGNIDAGSAGVILLGALVSIALALWRGPEEEEGWDGDDGEGAYPEELEGWLPDPLFDSAPDLDPGHTIAAPPRAAGVPEGIHGMAPLVVDGSRADAPAPRDPE